MISGSVWVDLSYYNLILDMSYERHWAGYRGADGTFCDPHFRANLAVSKRLHDAHRIAGVTVYIVYRPGRVTASAALVKSVIRDVLGGLPRWVTFEIDAETWGGKIRGNHSAELNRMAALLAAYAGNDIRRVIGYGNRSDLASMWPARIAGLRINVASYGTRIVDYPHMIAQQYGDGTTNRWGHPPGLPLSTRNVGRVDHNIFLGLTPAQVALALGVLDPPRPTKATTTTQTTQTKPTKPVPGTTAVPTGDDEMALTAETKKEIAGIVDARLQHWLPRLVETLRHGITNAAFPAKAPLGGPTQYAGVVDGVGIDGVVRTAAAGAGYFFAAADAKGKPTGPVYLLLGDKRHRIRTRAELAQLNPGKTITAIDPTSALFTLATV